MLRRRRQPRRGWQAVNEGAPFDPRDAGKIKRWYRLAASTPVSSEYETVVDVLGGASLSQTDADRKPAVASAANGLPMALLDGSDMLLMPLDTAGAGGNNATDQWELDCYWTIASVTSATQRIFCVDTSSGANLNRLRLTTLSSGVVSVDIFITNANGRNFATPAVTNGIHHLRFAYNKDGTQDSTATPAATDKMRVWIDGIAQSLTATDVGAGGALAALRSATGTGLFGAASDSDAPVAPQLNGARIGPNITIADAILTDAEAANLRLFEVPT